MKRFLIRLLPGLCLLLLAGTAFAGGVVVSLEGALPNPVAGQTFDVNFTIFSAHDGSPQDEFHPIVSATRADTGETVTARAVASGEPGRYTASLSLPTAGTWQWQITPEADYPSELVNTLTPLTVTAPVASQAAAPAFGFADIRLWMLLLLGVLAAGLALLAARRLTHVRA